MYFQLQEQVYVFCLCYFTSRPILYVNEKILNIYCSQEHAKQSLEIVLVFFKDQGEKENE